MLRFTSLSCRVVLTTSAVITLSLAAKMTEKCLEKHAQFNYSCPNQQAFPILPLEIVGTTKIIL